MGERFTPAFEREPTFSSESPPEPAETAQPRLQEPTEQEAPNAPSAELTPQEREQKEKIVQEMIQGLSALYELLPRQGEIKTDSIKTRIEQTESKLKELTPLMKNTLSKIAAKEKLHLKPKEEFVQVGLGILDLWIHMQALGEASTDRLSQLQAELRQQRRDAEDPPATV